MFSFLKFNLPSTFFSLLWHSFFTYNLSLNEDPPNRINAEKEAKCRIRSNKEGFQVVGYCRKSQTREDESNRPRLLQIMIDRLKE
ncbi:uncharacterized protein BYT42DRAFT_501825 [Radiomyces spectabilis]|uniref:uncharacterized protein n=1 Tax=Radiomyces spectabilis TaxID=64574 RepID=UPI0022205992|nr:uncharacterized protein BYT42DRAFT_501825 [Radiomyces spectabilis]KAI8371786.1 hypothetical protein BYT42DRAFT_501825 [Radiomyces spectabilis]